MDVVSLQTVVETAMSEDEGKNLSGPIKSFEEAFSDKGLASLERSFNGMFGYLAFFPGVDSAVTDYVKAGSLGSDSGRHCLVMFTLDAATRRPAPLSEEAFASWLDVDATEHPSSTFVRALVEPSDRTPMPALVLFAKWTQPTGALMISLEGLDEDGVRARLRGVFTLVEATRDEQHPDRWMNESAAEIARQRIPYSRSGPGSVRERLWRAGYFATDHLNSIVAVVGLAL